MTGLAVESASSRRTVVASVVAAFALNAFTAVGVQAQDPAPAQQQAPAEEQDLFKFTSDAGLIIWYINPDQTAAFEEVWNAIRNKLATTDKPELKALGDSLRVYKSLGEASPQGVNYFFVADPASKDLSYSPSPFLLFTSGLFTEDAEARALFDKLNAALAGINPIPLARIDVTPPPAQ